MKSTSAWRACRLDYSFARRSRMVVYGVCCGLATWTFSAAPVLAQGEPDEKAPVKKEVAAEEPEPAPVQVDYLEIRQFKDKSGAVVKLLDPMKQRAAYNELTRVKNSVQRTGKPADAEEEKRWEHFTALLISQLTWKDTLASSGTRNGLKAQRDEIKRVLMLLGQAAVKDAHTAFNQKLLSDLKEIAGNQKYHPAARVNAVLILGDLNSVEPNAQGLGAVPWSEVLPLLQNTVTNEKTNIDLRVVAMAGLLRHAQNQIVPAERAKVARDMVDLLTVTPEDGMKPGEAWLRHRALDVLAAMAAKNWNEARVPGMVNVINKLVADRGASMQTRADATRLLGQVVKPGEEPPVLIESRSAIVTYLCDIAVLKPEPAPAPKSKPKPSSGLMGGGMMGGGLTGGGLTMPGGGMGGTGMPAGMGGGAMTNPGGMGGLTGGLTGGKQKPEKEKKKVVKVDKPRNIFREGVLYYTACALIGMDGMEPAIPADDKAVFAALLSQAEEMFDTCASTTLTETQMAEQLYKQGEDLASWEAEINASPASPEAEPAKEQAALTPPAALAPPARAAKAALTGAAE